MEKPTGVIQKIIESLQQINALDVYSPIEKEIILHNLRAAYMIFLNIPPKEKNDEAGIEKLFVEAENLLPEDEQAAIESLPNEEVIEEEIIEEEIPQIEEDVEESNEEQLEDEIEEELQEEYEEKLEEELEEELKEESFIEEEIVEIEIVEETIIEEEIVEETPLVEEIVVEQSFVEETTEVVEVTIVPEVLESPVLSEIPTPQPLADDILEFIPDAKPQPTTLFEDALSHHSEKKSLNDLLTDKKDDNSISARFQQSYIPDLTKAIAINEKFTFIRELFRNSGVDFSNAIQKLNECENIDTAFALMEELKHQYIWDITSSAYLTLCDLVRRRFI